MLLRTLRLRTVWLPAVSLIVATLAFAQGTPTPLAAPAAVAPPPAPAPPPPPSPVGGIRNKLSAGDLLSAESILEVHRAKNGEDGPYLTGLSWLARGALLLGDLEKAARYAADVRTRCDDSTRHGDGPERSHDVETALGAAIEVQAQILERSQGARAATTYVEGELAKLRGPVALVARLHKRVNMMAMTGTAAPEIAIEDWVGEKPPTLASLRGHPVLLFVWAEGCGDCKAQEATLARVVKRHAPQGLRLVALTRYYDDPPGRPAEKARVDSVWKSVYADVGVAPIVISTASMERYGGSSTPTFVFVDREGVVRGYTPTRLTEPEFDRWLAKIVR